MWGESAKKKAEDTPEQAAEAKDGIRELSADDLESVSGGGAFDGVPRVKEYDYTDDIRNRV